MKVVFMGTPDFAVPSLKMLIEKHEVCAVVTQPDRPKGRGNKMISPIIKQESEKHGITVFQPQKVRDNEFTEIMRGIKPDVIVVVAFGQILPEDILNIPKFGCINVHGSLLPKYRGAAPIQWSVINGEQKTGVTTMYMAKGLDSGDMIMKSEIEMEEDETYGSLHDRMSIEGANILERTLTLIEKGTAERIPQNHDEMTLAPMITKETEHINWTKKNDEIINLIKGLSPIPGAYTNIDGEALKIWGARVVALDEPAGVCGEIIEINKEGFTVQTGKGGLFISEVQARGGKRMATDAYMRGHKIEKGTVLN